VKSLVIRRTVARAFGASPSGKPSGDWPLEETAGNADIERFLRDLHRTLEEVAAGEGGARQGVRLRLTRPETLPEGVEFVLAADGAAIRFLDTLLGFVRVIISSRDGSSLEEVLSLHQQSGAQRPIWKPLARPAARECRRRTGFRFTSISDLALRYAAILSAEPRG
jgi:hypothetical protein